MTDAVAIELIRAVAQIPGAVGGCAAAWFAYRASTHAREAAETSKRAETNSNGIKDQLVNLTAKSSFAAGKLEGENQGEHNNR